MLKTLSVWNFALIEHAVLEFCEGLTIMTGETGAGKSILIDALGAVLGHRISADAILSGEQWFRVEAVFDIAERQDIAAFLLEHAVEEADGSLIVSRRVAKNGRSSIALNGCHTTLTVLRQLGELLVDMHGQHENQALLRAENQMAMLDAADSDIKPIAEGYRAAYRKWRKLEDALLQREKDSRQNAQHLDMLRWQTEEIAAADLKENEDEKLEEEIRILANAEKIAGLVKNSYMLLETGDKTHSAILPGLAEVKKSIETLSRYDQRAENTARILSEAICQLEECSYEIRGYGESLDFAPDQLEKLQNRMDIIYKLRKKYGATIADVLEHYRKAKVELDQIANYDQILSDLKGQLQAAEQEADVLADQLTARRKQAAGELSRDIQRHLVHLGMPGAAFQIAVEPLPKKNSSGMDRIVMLFSGNVGETVKPLEKIASGGELSRIALAMKAVSAAKDAVGVMIFDEIDTGIGGKTAQMVAERIAMVAAHKQVLCITHLPQIACMADAHLYIEKKVLDGITRTTIHQLTGAEQIEELARMASGADLTQAALDNAAAMQKIACDKKKMWIMEQ